MPAWFLAEEAEYKEAELLNLTAAVNEAHARHQDYRKSEARVLLELVKQRTTRLKEELKMPVQGDVM